MERDVVVGALQYSLTEGSFGLSNVPGLVRRVIDEDCWRERVVRARDNQIATFSSFEEFMTASPPRGLQTNLKILKRLCADDQKAMAAIAKVTARRNGGDRGNQYTGGRTSNRSSASQGQAYGTTAIYAIRRLQKSRPDLQERVLAGELSPSQAMEQAGFRPPTATIRLDDPASAARTIRKKMAPDVLRDLISLLLQTNN